MLMSALAMLRVDSGCCVAVAEAVQVQGNTFDDIAAHSSERSSQYMLRSFASISTSALTISFLLPCMLASLFLLLLIASLRRLAISQRRGFLYEGSGRLYRSDS
ncbi:hypothetical protein AS181_22025 [Gordonia sp. SGD-V-85]|nr:hypothetical protein AS181_22025 [Gordonia sp. SGD-V-85]